MKKKILFLTLLLMLCLSLTACGANQMSQPADNSRAEYDEAGYGSEEYKSESAISTSVNPSAPALPDPDSAETVNKDFATRKLIKDILLTIQTRTFDEFMENLQNEIHAHGGFIQKSDISGNSYNTTRARYATIVVRIPAAKLELFTDEVSTIGQVTQKSESVQDVTMDYIDLESRLKALTTEQESLLKLLSEAEDLTDILTVQARLTEVRTQLESYESRLRTYQDLISYSTVTLEIYEVERIVSVESKNLWQEIRQNLSDNLYDINQGLRSSFIWFVSNLPYFALTAVLILVALLIRLSLRKIRRGKQPLE